MKQIAMRFVKTIVATDIKTTAYNARNRSWWDTLWAGFDLGIVLAETN